MQKQHIQLTEQDQNQLETMLSSGQQSAKVFKRATALLALNRGETLEATAVMVGVTNETVGVWRNQYRAAGLKFLTDQPRPGRPPTIDGLQRAQITALACSEAPAGHSQWSLRLLADKVVELKLSEHLSHSHVGRILKKTNSSPTAASVGASQP